MTTNRELFIKTLELYGLYCSQLAVNNHLLDDYQNSLLINEERRERICNMIEDANEALETHKDLIQEQLIGMANITE